MPEALAITRADHTMARSNARKRKPCIARILLVTGPFLRA
jgi:hypothetical protein